MLSLGVGDRPARHRCNTHCLSQFEEGIVDGDLPRHKAPLDLDEHVVSLVKVDQPLQLLRRRLVVPAGKEQVQRAAVPAGQAEKALRVAREALPSAEREEARFVEVTLADEARQAAVSDLCLGDEHDLAGVLQFEAHTDERFDSRVFGRAGELHRAGEGERVGYRRRRDAALRGEVRDLLGKHRAAAEGVAAEHVERGVGLAPRLAPLDVGDDLDVPAGLGDLLVASFSDAEVGGGV
jgi:hypothetical protein